MVKNNIIRAAKWTLENGVIPFLKHWRSRYILIFWFGIFSSSQLLMPFHTSILQFGMAALAGPNTVTLDIPDSIRARPNSLVVLPISFIPNEQQINALAFSIDYDESKLRFDPSAPYSITYHLPPAFNKIVFVDVSDNDGQLDFLLEAATMPSVTLTSGVFLSITLQVLNIPDDKLPIEAPVNFSSKSGESCGNTQGKSVLCQGNGGSILISKFNTPPEVRIFIIPEKPKAGEALSVKYTPFDADGDTVVERIHWTRQWNYDIQRQPGLDDKADVPEQITVKNEYWCVQVTPYDGQVYGQPEKACVYIDGKPNLPPLAKDVKILPSAPNDDSTLELVYQFDDPDDPVENKAQALYWWYRDDILQPAFNNQSVLPPEVTYPGETWCVRVQLHDGHQLGTVSELECVYISPNDHVAPIATNVMITPTTPDEHQDLTLMYDCCGTEAVVGDKTEIRWYRNGDLQPAWNDLSYIDAVHTLAGDQWYATVRPHDGYGFGLLVGSPVISITAVADNPPPVVDNVQISPSHPSGAEALRLSYDYQDADGAAEGTTRIYWYRNLEPVPYYDGFTVIPPEKLSPGDIWFARVIPFDGLHFGLPSASESVQIAETNRPPEVFEVYLAPGTPGDDAPLVLHYTFFDENNDPEGSTQIEWSLNGIAQTDYAGQNKIPAPETEIGQEWCAQLTPNDGKTDGVLAASNCVTIQSASKNTPPIVEYAYIEPIPKASNDDNLLLQYHFVDVDGDKEGGTHIFWYQNGVHKEVYDNQTLILSEFTEPGDLWHAQIELNDGTVYSLITSTEVITINQAIRIENMEILPEDPFEYQTLSITFTYSDPDGDPLEDIQVRWYKNGISQSDYADLHLPAGAAKAGEQWHATVITFDGYDYGEASPTPRVTIQSAEKPPFLYLPAISQLKRTHDVFYEPNDAVLNSYGPLQEGKVYSAYADDPDDWYFIMITQTTTIDELRVENYRASGQMVIYGLNHFEDGVLQYGPIANDGRRWPTLKIPNRWCPKALKRLAPGVYYVRIYSVGNYNAKKLYQMQLRYR